MLNILAKYCMRNRKRMRFQRFSYALCCLIIVLLFMQVSSERVGNFAYKGPPEDLNDTDITVHNEMVALSNYVYVDFINDTIINSIETPTIFFVIDHSGSMYKQGMAQDQMGNRFNVPRDLIDTLYNRYPFAEVGVGVFRQYLYFYKPDNDLFEECPEQDTGAYVPLFRLNKEYPPDNKMGYEIVKEFLLTDTITDSNNNYTYVDLEYVLSNTDVNQASTNINSGFDAATHAMLKSAYAKSHHFVIFLSDGDATYPNGPTQNDFEQGIDVPTTFTIFFTRNGQVPPSIRRMTENIKNNGYSITNPNSDHWAFENTSYDSLMKFIMENVISQISSSSQGSPTEIVIGNMQSSNWDSTGFALDRMIPLLGRKTDIKFDVKYHVEGDTLNAAGEVIHFEYDTTLNIDYDVLIDDNANEPPANKFKVSYWDRTLGFYEGNTQVQTIHDMMKDLQIKFKESKLDILYGYKKAKIEVRSTLGDKQDKETFDLDKGGNNEFSKKIKAIYEVDPTEGNGVLELDRKDKVIAVFRNDYLILDTLEIEVDFEQRMTPFELEPHSVAPTSLDSVQAEVIDLGPLKKHLGDKSGLLVQLLPDTTLDPEELDLNMRGSLTIYDVLGNEVITDEEMTFIRDKSLKDPASLSYIWDCRNSQGRYVGIGTYLVTFKAFSTQGEGVEFEHDIIKHMIGLSK